jgi:hypothetical protein
MYKASLDCITFVDAIGQKMNHVPRDFMRKTGATALPMAKRSVALQKVFTEIHQRFAKGDHRITEVEIGEIAELAQWLHNLHAEMNRQPPKQLTVHAENLIVRERIIG